MARRSAAAMIAGTTAAAMLFVGNANAAIVATVPLGTAANYAVLAGSTVTNVPPTVLNGSLGLWPGTSVTGAPVVVPPATTDVNNAVAQQAQSDLTVGYNNAAGRPLDASTPADLANLHLAPGVYAGPAKSALLLSGPLTLDGGGDPTAVFIFQTDSTLTTASASTVSVINGAQECNVFWQIGSSATLGTGSVFTGNILALTSITVNTSVVVHGRALARNGAVTLDTDTFVKPTCATSPAPATTTTAAPGATTSTTAAPAAPAATTSTTAPPAATTSTTAAPPATTSTTAAAAAAAGATTTTPSAATPVTVAAVTPPTQVAATPTTAAPITALSITSATVPANSVALTPASPGTGVPSEIITTATGTTTPALPRTGAPIGTMAMLATMLLTLGFLVTRLGRPRARA